MADLFTLGWEAYLPIDVQDDNVDGNLTDFPLIVPIYPATHPVESAAIGARSQSAGQDIRFTLDDGETLLKYQIEYFSISGGDATAVFWVKVPSIAASGGATIRLYYGNDGASDGQDAPNVWATNQSAVWLMADGAGSGTVADSTGNGYTATLTNMNTTTSWVLESEGMSLDFAGANSGDYLQLASPISYADVDWSLSMLLDLDSLYNIGYLFGNTNSAGAYTRMLFTATGLVDVYQDANTRARFSIGSLVTGLHCYHLVYDSSTNVLTLYRDGASVIGVASVTGTWSFDKLFSQGDGTSGDDPIDGRCLNFMLFSDQRSAAEIKFRSANFLEADNELTVGSEVVAASAVAGSGAVAGQQAVAAIAASPAVSGSAIVPGVDTLAAIAGSTTITATAAVHGRRADVSGSGQVSVSAIGAVPGQSSTARIAGQILVTGSGAVTGLSADAQSIATVSATAHAIAVHGQQAHAAGSGRVAVSGTGAVHGQQAMARLVAQAVATGYAAVNGQYSVLLGSGTVTWPAVSGPYRTAAAWVHRPGATAMAVHRAGAVQSSVHHAGATDFNAETQG